MRSADPLDIDLDACRRRTGRPARRSRRRRRIPACCGLPSPITSIASVTTAPSTQPPETEPWKLPSASMTRWLPTGRGAEPQVSTTVAMRHVLARLRPGLGDRQQDRRASSRAVACASHRSGSFAKYGHAARLRQASGADRRRGRLCVRATRTRSASASRLWTARNSSTCGSIARTPRGPRLEAVEAQQRIEPDQPPAGSCSRSISSVELRRRPSRSSPSVISSTTAPWPSTRRDHSRLNSCSAWPMRVPPDQSLHAPRRSGQRLVGIAAGAAGG